MRDIAQMGYSVRLAQSPEELAASAQLIVTTTAAHDPYLLARYIKPGTHITAMGSDTPDKNEIDAATLRRAALVVADSIPQCLLRGEIRAAIAAEALKPGDVADLTGVAIQDIMIAKAVVDRPFNAFHAAFRLLMIATTPASVVNWSTAAGRSWDEAVVPTQAAKGQLSAGADILRASDIPPRNEQTCA